MPAASTTLKQFLPEHGLSQTLMRYARACNA